MPEKTALIGLHDNDFLETMSRVLVRRGFQVTATDNLDDMLQAMGIGDPIPSTLPASSFTAYLMDLNLGQPGSINYAPALTVYNLVRSYVEAGEVKFLGVSLNDETVALAQKVGIPAISPMKPLKELLELLESQ